MNLKNSNAARTTITRDLIDLETSTGNIYESILIMSKRANQISVQMKEELASKLQEFSSAQDNLEEVFENREQIEVSRFYERLPKAHAMAVEELLSDEIYFRRLDADESLATSGDHQNTDPKA